MPQKTKAPKKPPKKAPRRVLGKLPNPDFSIECAHGADKGRIVVGVDEVGRGPLAGPVVAAAVCLPYERVAAGEFDAIRDSKQLNFEQRSDLEALILAHGRYAIAASSVHRIDQLNILHASMDAMQRAVLRLDTHADVVMVDGNRLPPALPCEGVAVVKGDQKSLSIAAASILAKQLRDRIMQRLDQRYPGFGWSSNMGYPTAHHRQALKAQPPTAHHRQSFEPVRAALLNTKSGR